jgi:hypothetical protein
MWSNRMLVLGAAAVGAAAMMVGPTAAPAGAEPCAPAVVPAPACTPPGAPPINSPGAPEAAGAPEGAGDLPAMDPQVGEPASAEVCGPAVAPTPCGVPAEAPPPNTAAMADSPPPPPNPCTDIGYFMSNQAVCMNPQTAASTG